MSDTLITDEQIPKPSEINVINENIQTKIDTQKNEIAIQLESLNNEEKNLNNEEKI